MGMVEYARELTVDDLKFIHEESSVGDYFTIDDDGEGVQLHDVVTRQPLVPYAVPEGVLQHPELAAGIQWLRECQPGRLTVQMILGSHGSADDFRRIVQQNGELLSGPWVALEMSWRSRHMRRDVQPDKVIKEPASHQYADRRAFQTEQLLWAYDNKKDTIPCEMPVDDDSVLVTELKHLWDDIYEPIRHDQDMTPAVRDAAARIAERAYQATRQWTIVAQLGNWLMRLDEAGRLPEQHNNLPLVIGSWHERSAERFESLGVAAEIHRTSDERYDTPAMMQYGKLVMDAAAGGHMDMNLLRTPLI